MDLYRSLKGSTEDLDDEVSFKRTDLALFDLNAAARIITCRLVEVKCYTGIGGLAAYDQLKSGVAEQIQQSQEVLARHFDPHRTPIDRPDRLIKTRELVTLLEFYLDRAERYQAITPESAEEARFLLRTLEQGYHLVFTRSAIIFDFEKPGTEPPEIEHGIEFHRIGVDLIRQLIEAAAPDSESDSGLAVQAGPPSGGKPPQAGIEQVRRRRERAPSVPTLDSAAFLVEERDRTVSWEKVHSRQALGEEELALEPTAEPEARSGPTDLAEDQHRSEGIKHSADSSVKDRSGVAREEQPCNVNDGHEGPPLAATTNDGPRYDVMLGVTGQSPQYGIGCFH